MEARRRTTARRDLERLPGFAQLSPAPGQLDPAAADALVADDPETALRVLAASAGAVDPALRRLARQLAGRVVLRLAAPGHRRGAAAGRLRLARVPAGAGGDLDLDGAVEARLEAAAGGRLPSLDELTARQFAPRRTAAVLVVDRSGSMGGERLAGAALAAAALAWRLGDAYAVAAFAGDVTVLKSVGDGRSPEAVVDDLLALRGHGSTDLALALEAAGRLLEDVPEAARTAVVLSDCRHNLPSDPRPAARRLGRVAVLCPAGDDTAARALAAACGGRLAAVAGAADIPGALAEALG